MRKKFYLTSAIPYVNAAPHIGHALEFIQADTIARFHKQRGEEVLMLSGGDENALKIVQAAEKAGMEPQKFCDVHNGEFLELVRKLNVHFDIWQRGTDRTHHFPASQKLWELCNKNGDIYKKSYEGLYCVGCESFYSPEDLDENGECFEHPGSKLEKVSEENYFFRLSNYQKFIDDLLTTDKLKIIPEIRKNEAVAFVKKGLEDFSISRSKERAKGWGVPVPGDPNQIMYVWFDALNIYQSGIGLGWDENQFKEWAPQDVMVIGKGIIRFHAIYWPAILNSAGLPLPQKLFAHGYLTVDGQKMSKTLGNVVDPIAVIDKYGTDAVRYYLLREIPSYGDGDFSERRFKEIYNADLANGLGNTVARIAKLAENSKLRFKETPLDDILSEAENKALQDFWFEVIKNFLTVNLQVIDRHIDQHAPWLEKDKNQLQTVLQEEIDEMRKLARKLQIFLPNTAEKILEQFKGPTIKSQPPLFPRLL